MPFALRATQLFSRLMFPPLRARRRRFALWYHHNPINYGPPFVAKRRTTSVLVVCHLALDWFACSALGCDTHLLMPAVTYGRLHDIHFREPNPIFQPYPPRTASLNLFNRLDRCAQPLLRGSGQAMGACSLSVKVSLYLLPHTAHLRFSSIP